MGAWKVAWPYQISSAGPKPRALSHLDVAQVQRDRLFSSVKPYDDSAGPRLFQDGPGVALQLQFWTARFPEDGKTSPPTWYYLNVTVTHVRDPDSRLRDGSPAQVGKSRSVCRELTSSFTDREKPTRAILNHQAKVIVVLEAGAALESHGGQRDILHLCSPLVSLAVTRRCPTVALLESVYQTFKGFFVCGDPVRLCCNVCWPICSHGFPSFVGVKATPSDAMTGERVARELLMEPCHHLLQSTQLRAHKRATRQKYRGTLTFGHPPIRPRADDTHSHAEPVTR